MVKADPYDLLYEILVSNYRMFSTKQRENTQGKGEKGDLRVRRKTEGSPSMTAVQQA